MNTQKERQGKLFEDKIKPLLVYVGTAGAILMSIGYIVLMFILVLGFKAQANFSQTVTFAVVNAVVGFLIMQFLKIQGVDFAKQLPENKELLDKYYLTKTKDKKIQSIKSFWVKSLISDVLVKGLSVVVSTSLLIYIVIEGSHDYCLLLLSVVNLLMFACFGLLSLVKSYDFYNDYHMTYIREQLKTKEQQDEKAMEVALNTSNQQGDDLVHTDRRVDILVASMDTCAAGYTNTKPVVLECGDCSDCVLGAADNTSNSTSDRPNTSVEENS